jgi:hypothetical protein
MIAPKITMLNGGRFSARHEGTTVYYRSRHKVLKLPVQGDVVLRCQILGPPAAIPAMDSDGAEA